MAPEPLSDRALAAMRVHYEQLLEWNQRLSLIGPGTADTILERHFGEALAALPLLSTARGAMLDVGSGAGFPGLVLAAARPGWQVTLVEARERKWSFLKTVVRKASLSAECLNARVAVPLPAQIPAQIDLVTMRAVQLPGRAAEALAERLGDAGRLLYWVGADDPTPPVGFRVEGSHPLPGSEQRRIVEIARAG